jgi:hypothetical protein
VKDAPAMAAPGQLEPEKPGGGEPGAPTTRRPLPGRGGLGPTRPRRASPAAAASCSAAIAGAAGPGTGRAGWATQGAARRGAARGGG